MRWIVILISVAVLTAILLWSENHPANATPTSKYDNYLNSVVVIESSDALGTGFFISDKGVIVTNNHVVGDDPTVMVRMRNQKTVTGVVFHLEPASDLAFLSIADKSPHWLELAGPNEGGVGAEVIAIGTAHGLSWSVSKGIISGIRMLDDIRLIQTDAAINVGNSGGPLILLDSGHVVGVNTIGSRKDVAEGIGFAVSADNIRAVAALFEDRPRPGAAPKDRSRKDGEKRKIDREKAEIKREWQKINEERSRLVKERFALETQKKELAEERKRLRLVAAELEKEQERIKAAKAGILSARDERSVSRRRRAPAHKNTPGSEELSTAYAINYFVKLGAEYEPGGFMGIPRVDFKEGSPSPKSHEFENSALPVASKIYSGNSRWIIHYAAQPGLKPVPFAWSHLPQKRSNYSLRDTPLYVDIAGDGKPHIRFRNSHLAVTRLGTNKYAFKFNPPGWLLRYAGSGVKAK